MFWPTEKKKKDMNYSQEIELISRRLKTNHKKLLDTLSKNLNGKPFKSEETKEEKRS